MMGATKVQLALAIASAAAQPDRARARLEMALAEARDTGICFYHAELLRLRTHRQRSRRPRAGAPPECASPELRAALDDFDLRGQPARPALADAADRVPADSALPELARAQAILAEQSPHT